MAEKYISGEEHHRVTSQSRNSKYSTQRIIYAAVLVIVLMALSFYGGVSYEKGHKTSTTAVSSRFGAGGGRFGGGFRADIVVGTVSSISTSSITVNDNRTGSTVTLAITSTTQITNNGQSASVSDIQSGDTVFVQKDTSNTSDAARIMINPSFGGFGGGGGNQSSGSATTGGSSTTGGSATTE